MKNTPMNRLSWVALFLESAPLLAVAGLGLLHPIGDPQTSQSVLVRMLDFQGTYWIRNAIPVPPPLLVVGTLISGLLWWHYRGPTALAGMVVGAMLLGLWSAIMVVPLLLHVQ